MKKFLSKTLVFMMIALLIPVLILLLPIDKKYQYSFVKNACTLKSNYIFHRLYEDSLPLDVVFLGSSHTMCGINDSIVQKTLHDQGRQFQVSNMGFCRLGRDMEYLIFKDIIRHKKPELLVLEVRQDEPELSHPDFGYMADISDVLAPPMILNRSYFPDLANAFTVRLNYTRDILSHKDYNTPYAAPYLAFLEKNIIADTADLYKEVRFRWNRYYSHPRSAWADDLMTRYPKSYIQKIMALAKENQVKVVMLYIPNFGYPFHQPKELTYYRQMADVILMPQSFFDDEKNWMEAEHLNCNAAAIMSDSVGHYISRYLH